MKIWRKPGQEIPGFPRGLIDDEMADRFFRENLQIHHFPS
jgi:hypothetical protein